MKIHLTWIRATAAIALATVVVGVGAQQAAAQYAPYRPIQQPPAAPQFAAPQQVAPQQAQPVYTVYRTPAAPTAAQPTAYGSPTTPTTSYGSPTGAQYAQPSSAYPQYPQTTSQYPTTYGAYPYVAQQSTDAMPAPSKPASAPPAQPSTSPATGAAPANGAMPAGEKMNAAQPCGCNGAASYGAGDYYSTSACGCNSGGYPNCGATDYLGDSGCNDNQWFGGIYFLEMGRTNATAVKLTAAIPTGAVSPPYDYPPSNTTVLDSRDANFDFREGVECRVGSTFTIGESCSTCQTGCGGNGCGPCNSGCGNCGPVTTYAWEAAWWGINDSPNDATVVYDGTVRLVGMKNFVGLQYDFGGNAPVNNFYGYGIPVQTGPPYTILAQRVRTDFKAQNLELNFIRFPVCNTCNSCNTCGCNSGAGACGCDDGCGGGLGFQMYGSCGVRYFHMDDDFTYSNEFGDGVTHVAYDGFTYDNAYELAYDVQVKNNLIGPQVGWTTDYCWRRWNVFINSTFGIFDNHMSANQRMWSGGPTAGQVTFSDGTTEFNVHSSKDAVAFLGELRVGTAYDFSCHWRGIIAYRAVAITGLATASTQLDNDYMDRATVAMIDSDNSVIIHGAQIGAECRY